MVLYFPFLFLAPIIFAINVLIDKKVLTGDHDGAEAGPLAAICGMFNLIGALVLGIGIFLLGGAITIVQFLPLMVNGVTYIAAMWLYMAAMKEEEATRVAPVFQIIPAIGLLGDLLILRNVPVWYVILGIFLTVTGSVILNFKKGKIHFSIILLMLGASLMLACNDVVFAKFGRDMSTSQALFADLSGKALWGLLILLKKSYREGFVTNIRINFWLLAFTEILGIGAEAIVDVGKLFFPVSVVQSVDCTQEIFTLVGAVLFSKYLPQFLEEEIGHLTLLQKTVGIIVVVSGGVLITVGTT